MTSGDGGTPEVGRGVDRRTVAKGAAWVAPALLVGAEAPAYAASGNIAVSYVSQCTAGSDLTRPVVRVTFTVVVSGGLTIPVGTVVSATANLGRAAFTAETYGGTFSDYLGHAGGGLFGNPATRTATVDTAVRSGTYTFTAQYTLSAVDSSSTFTLNVQSVTGETSTQDNYASCTIVKDDSSRPAC